MQTFVLTKDRKIETNILFARFMNHFSGLWKFYQKKTLGCSSCIYPSSIYFLKLSNTYIFHLNPCFISHQCISVCH